MCVSYSQGRGWLWNMSRWDKQQDTGWARANKKYTWEREPARASLWPWIEAMKDIFARCSKKMAAQVCTKLWLYKITRMKKRLSWLSVIYYLSCPSPRQSCPSLRQSCPSPRQSCPSPRPSNIYPLPQLSGRHHNTGWEVHTGGKGGLIVCRCNSKDRISKRRDIRRRIQNV